MIIKDIRSYKKLSDNGIRFYKTISKKRKILGISLFVIALLPNGLFIPCSLLGCVCLGVDCGSIKERVFKNSLLLKYKLGVLK